MTQARTQQRRRPPRPATPRQAAGRSSPLDPLLDPEIFRALGDRTRLTLVACIAKCGRACSVGEVAECCSVDLSVVSRHLALLARAGVLHAEKQGRVVRYAVRYVELAGLLRALADAIESCSPGCSQGECDGCC